MTTIATAAQYQAIENITLTGTETTRVEGLLAYATELVQNWCDREFTSTTRSEWVTQNAQTDRDIIFPRQYPIIQIRQIAIPGPVGTILNTDATITNPSVSLMPTATIACALTWYDQYGDLQEVDIPLSAAKTLNGLKAEIEEESGWQFTVDPQYTNVPTSTIQPVGIQQCGIDKADVLAAVDYSVKADVLQDNAVKVNQVIDKVYLRYTAGYETIPLDLVTVVCHVANDLMMVGNSSVRDSGTPNANSLKSETVKDYSYTKFDKFTLDQIVEKYQPILDRYRRQSFLL